MLEATSFLIKLLFRAVLGPQMHLIETFI